MTGFCCPSSSRIKTAPPARGLADRYRYRGSSGSAFERIGGSYNYALTKSKACWHSSVQTTSFLLLTPFSRSRKGKQHAANFKMNLHNAARLPANFCMSFWVLGGVCRQRRVEANVRKLKQSWRCNYQETKRKISIFQRHFIFAGKL